MKNKMSALIRIVVSFGLLGLLFWLMRHEIKDICRTIAASDIRLICLGAVLFLLNVSFLGVRLKVIFKGENLDLKLSDAIKLTYIGYYFNNFMPTAVGGDIVKGHYAAHATHKKLQSYASVMMDRLIGLFTFLIVAAFALVFDRGRSDLPLLAPMVFVLVIVGIFLGLAITNIRVASFMRTVFARFKLMGIGEKINSLYDIVHDYRNRGDIVLKAFTISIFSQSIYFVMIYLFFRALGYVVPLGNIFLIMPIVTFISMIPSLGGLGVREGALVAFFTPLTNKEAAFAVSILVLFGLLLISLLGGIIYLWWGFSGLRKEVLEDPNC